MLFPRKKQEKGGVFLKKFGEIRSIVRCNSGRKFEDLGNFRSKGKISPQGRVLFCCSCVSAVLPIQSQRTCVTKILPKFAFQISGALHLEIPCFHEWHSEKN